MALNIGHLFDAVSSESEPEGDPRALSDHDRSLKTSINKKSDELQKAALEGIYLNHQNMAHHFNCENCSIDNLVWAPMAKVDEGLSMREAEAELKKIETLWIRKMCSVQPWGMNHIEIHENVRTHPYR